MKQKKFAVFVTLPLVCALAAGARADIKYSQKMTLGDGGTPISHTTRYVADGKERDDNKTLMGNYESTESRVFLCQTKQTVVIDRALKIYAVVEKDSSAPRVPGAVPARKPKSNANKGKPGEGKVAVNTKVTTLPNEKVAGFDTHHYMVEMHTVTSGCIGNSDITMKMELWVSNIKDAVACKEKTINHSDFFGYADADGEENCKITFVNTGDTAKFNSLWDGIIMRQKIYQDGKLVSVQEMTSLSQAKLEDSVFEVPAGFTKLSEEEYQKRRQDAMMKAMMKGALTPGNAPAASNDNNNNANTDNTNDADAPAEAEEAPKPKKPKSIRKRFKLPF